MDYPAAMDILRVISNAGMVVLFGFFVWLWKRHISRCDQQRADMENRVKMIEVSYVSSDTLDFTKKDLKEEMQEGFADVKAQLTTIMQHLLRKL